MRELALLEEGGGGGRLTFDILKLKEIESNFSLFLIRFAIFRRILDAEMKAGTRAGVGLLGSEERNVL